MARLQDFQTVTPTDNDKMLVVQSQGQGLATFGDVMGTKMDKANPKGTGSFSMNRKANTTTGPYSVTEGENGEASGRASHAEGTNNTASGAYSHAEGYQSIASGGMAHAENRGTTASGDYSHSEGYGTIANHRSQHVFGEFNTADASTAAITARGNYIEVVGKGTADNARSNARTLDWQGNEVLAGNLTINGNVDVGDAIASLDHVSIKSFSIATGGSFTITARSGFVVCGQNNTDSIGYACYFMLGSGNIFRIKRISAGTSELVTMSRDNDTGIVTITNNTNSYVLGFVFYRP